MIKIKTGLAIILVLMSSLACNDEQHRGADTSSSLPYTEKTACLLSEIAYCSTPGKSLDKYMPEWKIKWEGTAIGGNSAFVASDGQTTAVAIRGSLIEFSWDALQNWLYQDLNVTSLEDWPYTKDSSRASISEGSFQGFDHLTKLVDKQTGKTLFEYLQSNIQQETQVLITGHSLGGNLATVYASWLWQELKKEGHEPKNMNVITFASPAAGNKSFAEDFDSKFPSALRYENRNDIVPKFPCRSSISNLGTLFDTSLAANKIEVGYKNATVSLDQVFSMLSTGMALLEFTNTKFIYHQPSGEGKMITIPLSGKNKGHDISNWLSEAGYQHGVARYAMQLGVPIVDCTNDK